MGNPIKNCVSFALVIFSASLMHAETFLITRFDAAKNLSEAEQGPAVQKILSELEATNYTKLEPKTDLTYLLSQATRDSDYMRLQAAAFITSLEMLVPSLELSSEQCSEAATLLKDSVPRVRVNGLRILAFAKEPKGQLPARFVPFVVPLMRDPDLTVAKLAAQVALSETPLTTPALEAIVTSYGDRPELRQPIIQTLGERHVTDSQSINLMQEALSATDLFLQETAVKSLGQLGEAATPALPSLIEKSTSASDETLRSEAKQAIAKIQPQPR